MNFLDRKVQYPNRIKLIKIKDESDGIVYDIQRAEGEISAEGTLLNAKNLNVLTNHNELNNRDFENSGHSGFQKQLVSGQNIKTINNQSLLGSGNIDLLNMIYPIGSLYLSLVNTSPASFIGGSWEALTSGPYLRIGAATQTAGDNGGSAKITINNMPSHSHYVIQYSRYHATSTNHTHPSNGWGLSSGPNPSASNESNCGLGTENMGSGTDYYPVYKNVYAWRRVS